MAVKVKRQTISALKKAVWTIFSRYIRLRDCILTTGSTKYGECISCGENKPFGELDAGHFVPKHSNNYFSEMGVHAQCKKCNRFQGGNPLGYRRGLVELYGEDIASQLETENKPLKKFTIQELESLKKYYTDKTKELENG